ncbi:MAG: DPP IV N-terminal domain-containing protein [Acidobacteria bacterium]|nr:DPP IV N-terminal domain-containing protein [Acidobacteriota bacterium]
MKNRTFGLYFALTGIVCIILSAISHTRAQDRLPAMPGHEQFQKMQAAIRGGPVYLSGAVTPAWDPEGRSFSYVLGGKRYQFELATMTSTVTGEAPASTGGRGGRGGPPVPQTAAQTEMPVEPAPGCPNTRAARGRQLDCAVSPDGKLKAFYRNRNLWIANFDGSNERQITTEGRLENRTKFGTGSWVYGEELDQTTAIWWSPDNTKVGFYGFDESKVQDYFLQLDQTGVQSSMDTEAYPKAGTDNPIPDVYVYDLQAQKTTKLDVRDGKPFSQNDVIGHYVYAMQWSPDGAELMMNRTNRRQQILEFIACSAATSKCRVIVREEWLTGWLDNRPPMRYLSDKKRFIWQSHRNGFTNYYLYDLSGRLINQITKNNSFDSGSIVKIDEGRNVMFYMARDGDNYMKLQLHRVGLDGTNDVRLTDPKFNHSVAACGGTPTPAEPASCGISPDNKYFVDVYQTHDQPPATQIVDTSTGRIVAQVAKSDMTRFEQLGLKKTEMFTYKAADGKTTLYGTISFPSNFDPSKKYSALASVYGGPGSAVTNENFATPNSTAEYGFLMLQLSSRSAPGQGRRVLDAAYMKLGTTEMDDMALAVKALWNRPYFDKTRVGIYGTSYGGYSAALSILRYPDVYSAASASSPVTSWYHYDTIYTERYMWIPQENEDGYEAGNAMKHAQNLKGRLLIYYGTADNNVHPNNAMQLIRALQQAGKSFEVQVGPDVGHSGINNARMMEFFIENLIMRPERLITPASNSTSGSRGR